LVETLLNLYARQLRFGSPLFEAFPSSFTKSGTVGSTPIGTNGATGKAAPQVSNEPSLLDALRQQQLIVEELLKIQALILRRLLGLGNGRSDPTHSRSNVASQPTAPGTHISNAEQQSTRGSPAVPGLVELLQQAERALLTHPLAAQAGFSALVAEGRRFASTPEGAALATALTSSPLIAGLRRLWETTTLNMLEENPLSIVPTMYVEALFRAAKSTDLEDVLRAFQGGRRQP
jgi:hypothetical protein